MYFSCFYLVVDCEVGELQCLFCVVVQQGYVVSEGWCVCCDGLLFCVSVVIELVVEVGELLGFVKIICDIIEQWQVQWLLCDVQCVLCNIQQFEMVGWFSRGLLYEFNNLLIIIGNVLDLLLLCVSGDDVCVVELFDVVQVVIDRGVLLICQLLVFSIGQILIWELVDINMLVWQWLLDL